MPPRRYMTPIVKIWNVSVLTTNLWLCTSSMRLFDELEDEFLEKEEEYTALVASYVDEHLDLFAKIIK